MASKRTNKRRGSDQTPGVERLRKLLQRAQGEVAELLKRNKAGTITQVQLQTELQEVKAELKEIDLHFYKL
jgi:hypothetical protein